MRIEPCKKTVNLVAVPMEGGDKRNTFFPVLTRVDFEIPLNLRTNADKGLR